MIDTKVRCSQCCAEGITAIFPHTKDPYCPICYGKKIKVPGILIRKAMKAALLSQSANKIPALPKGVQIANV